MYVALTYIPVGGTRLSADRREFAVRIFDATLLCTPSIFSVRLSGHRGERITGKEFNK